MPSRTDTAGHTKPFIYPAMDHWGRSQGGQFGVCELKWYLFDSPGGGAVGGG